MTETVTEGDGQSGKTMKESLGVLLFLSCIFFLNFASRILFAPLLPKICRELSLDHTQAGSLFLFMSTGYCISVLLSGSVSSRLNHHRTIVASSALSGLAMIGISQCSTIVSLRVGLGVLGYCAGLYLPSGLYTITRTVSQAYLARGIAIHEVAPNLAFVLAPLAGSFILSHGGWRLGVGWMGAVLIGVALWYWLRGAPCRDAGQAFTLSTLQYFFRLPEFWMLTGMFSAAICSTIGIYAMLPLFLVTDRGLNPDYVNSLVALSRISTIFMPLVAGWFGDTFGNKRVVIGILLLAGVLTVPIGIFHNTLLTLFIFLQPMIAVCFFPSGFALLAEIKGENGKGNAVALAVPIAFLTGGGILPTLIGMLGDFFSLASGLVVSGLLMTGVSLLSMVYFRQQHKSIITP